MILPVPSKVSNILGFTLTQTQESFSPEQITYIQTYHLFDMNHISLGINIQTRDRHIFPMITLLFDWYAG
jgi:hypothetical protein